MATPGGQLDRATIELVLSAAADVVFSDGISPAFLAHWVDETAFLLSLIPMSTVPVYDARLPPG